MSSTTVNSAAVQPAAQEAGAGFRALLRDIAGFAGWRLARVGALAVAAAGAEGMGLLLMVPLLQMLGLGGKLAVPGTIGLEGALALYVILVAAAAWVVALRTQAVAALRTGYADDLRRRLHRALTGLEWRAFSRLRSADAIHVITSETARSAHGVDFLLQLAGWAVEIPVLLAVSLHLSPLMTAAALAIAGLCVLAARPLDRRTHALGQRQGEAMQAMHADLADDLGGMRVIRSLGLEEERRRRISQGMDAVRQAQLAHQRSASRARAVLQGLAALAAALGVWGSVHVMGMSLAETLVLMAAFARLLAASLRIQNAWRTVLHTLPAHAAVHDFLERCRSEAEPEPAGAPPSVPALTRELRLEGVTFRYAAGLPPVLSEIDAVIPARAMTAVVGPSGAGKSTLADLLLGLTEPESGRMLVDGVPVSGPARRSWRRRVGYVPQESFLFHDTVRANLTVAAPQVPESVLWTALDRAAAAEFVRGLPAGLDTVVGDRGGLLSGGQRQRIALARALLTEPDLLILDEATSALDTESERQVLDALEALRGRLTVVVIAHRSSTVRSADHVIALGNGRVVSSEPWAEPAASAGQTLPRFDG